MRRLRVILLVVGILFLVAGVWEQDHFVSQGAVMATNVISQSKGAPSWDDLNYAHEFLQVDAQTGLVLKLTGFAILLSLFFLALRREGESKNHNILLPSLLGLGSGVCFAIFSVQAPVAKTVWWAMKAFATRLPSGLETRGLSELQNARFAEGIFSVTGSIVLAAGLFLLAAALMRYRRTTGKAIPILLAVPSLFIFLAQGREMPEVRCITWFDVLTKAGVFFYIAIIFSIVALAIFVRGLMVRKKAPEKMVLLTVALLVITGFLATAFWVTSLLKISAIHSSELQAVYRPAPLNIAEYSFPLEDSAFLFSICLMLCAVFLPILCAFSLRHLPEQTTETRPAGKPVFPLIAGGLTLIAFAAAGFFGLRENPYRTALRKVSLPYGLYSEFSDKEWVKDDLARIESEEGLSFLREMVNPRISEVASV
jgi:hypothetical protein